MIGVAYAATQTAADCDDVVLMDMKQPTPEPQPPSRWPGVYWLMSQDFKRRYGCDAGNPPPPGTPRRKVQSRHDDPDDA